MPAILVEPFFVSNPEQAEWLKAPDGIPKLAQVLVQSIEDTFPLGGLIGFSVGHKGKVIQFNDRGAKVYGGGFEADYAEKILRAAKGMLEK